METMRNPIKICLLLALLLSAVAIQAAALTVMNIAAGFSDSLFLKGNGSLWAMGDNNNGELGDGTTDGGLYDTNRPQQIVASNVIAIAAGNGHSLFLKSDGSLWAMGENVWGQLGDGGNNANGTNSPEEIVSNGVTAIAAGDSHSLFLKSDGSVWSMGNNGNGQLGDGTYNSMNRPEQIVGGNVTAIAAGAFHSLFLRPTAVCGRWATTATANWGRHFRLWNPNQQRRGDYIQRCHGDRRRRWPQSFS